MKKNTSSMLFRYGFTACLSLGAVAVAQEESKETKSVTVEEVANTERVMRQKNELEAKVLKKSSIEAEAKGEFEAAINFASQSLEKFKTVSKTDEKVLAEIAGLEKSLLRLKYGYVDSLIDSAVQNNDPESAEQALELLKELQGADSSAFDAIEKIIEEANAAKLEAERKSTVSAEQIAEVAEEEELDASTILEKCGILYENQEFEEAINEIEKLLVKQPYNVEANKFLAKVYAELRRIGVIRRDVVQNEKISEVTWKWSNPLNPEQESVSVTTQTETKSVSSGIFKKLELVIPKVNYVNASVESVVSNIKRVTKLLDPDGVGLNIVLKISKDLSGDSGLEDDTFGEGAEATGVNLEFDQIPVEELLKYFCDQAGLKYRVEEYAVVITEKGAETSFDMTTKFYPVAPNFQDAIDGTEGGGGDDGFGGGDDFEDDFGDFEDDFEDDDFDEEGGDEELGEEEDLDSEPAGGSGNKVQEYFESLGVSFPEGATVKYVSKVSRLVVKNTAENLRKVESALEHINVIQNQIMIESKFAEVSQTDNEELGFDWIYRGQNGRATPGLDVNGDNGATVISNGTTDRPTFLSSGTKDGNYAVRPLVQAVEDTGIQAGLPVAGANNLEIDAVIGSADFSVFIRSIDQKRNLDVLTAPKVTTTTGNPAIVKVIDERYFPVEFEDPEIVEVQQITFVTGGLLTENVQQTENTIIRPHPVYEEPTELGVVLEVTPKVNPDNYTIELTLNPRVTEFVEYDSAFDALLDPDGDRRNILVTADTGFPRATPPGFDFANPDPDVLDGPDNIANTDDDLVPFELGTDEAVNLRYSMPIITSRTIDTQVMVWDGETIVLGGLSNEESIVYNDGIPYLKEIPFLGRLFETKGAQKVKTNLLIFVTSRLVKPDGVPRRTNEVRGIPDYKRI